jgi:hypothetical protein
MFKNSSAFWNWLVTSSSDPTQVALTVKGIITAIVPVLAVFIHAPNLSTLPDDIYSAVVAVFAVFSAAITAYGLIRKLFFPSASFVASLHPGTVLPFNSKVPPAAPPSIGS